MPKPIFYIMVLLAVAIAVIYFYQKKSAEGLLEKLISDGSISVSEKIEALPIVIIDAKNKSIHLLAGNKHQAINFADIKSIDIYRSPDRGNNAGGQVGPDYATITNQAGERFRFDNLTLSAAALKSQLQQYPELAPKLKLNNNK